MVNQKGGCGKTTSAVGLAAGLSIMGYSVCIVDLDSQCNATQSFSAALGEIKGIQYSALDIYLKNRKATDIRVQLGTDKFIGGLSIVPGHRSLAQVHAKLEADLRTEVITDERSPEEEDDIRLSQRGRLRKSLASLKDECDFIILDTPPELGFIMSTALQSADWFCLPVFPSQYDLDGLKRLTQTVAKIRQRSNSKLDLLGVVVGNFDQSTKLDSQILEVLEKSFRDKVFPPIHRGVRIREAAAHGVTIFEHAPDTVVAIQFMEICELTAARVQAALDVQEGFVPTTAVVPQPQPAQSEVRSSEATA